MAQQIRVPFHGEGSGTGELTWGQRGVWRSIVFQGASEYISGIARLPAGLTVDDLATAMAFAMGRHQSLRTKLVFGPDGDPKQRVFESGEVVVQIVDAGEEDPDVVAARIRQQYESVDFDYANDWPVRMAAVCVLGAPARTVAVYSHLAIDALGLDVLLADLATRDGPARPVMATQPLAQARQQNRASAQRHTDSALRHWERVLSTVAPQRFGESGDTRDPRYWKLTYFSAAAERAMRAIAARNATDTSPVLMAGYAVALATTVGNNPVALQIAVSNRFRPGFAESVSVLAQASPCMIDLADATFDEVVGRARQASMTTYLNAYYDPVQRAALVAKVNEERGADIELGCYFNDRRAQRTSGTIPSADEITAALTRSRLTWGEPTNVPEPPLYLNVDDVPDGVEFTMVADTFHLSPSDMETVVRTVESVVVQAARDATVTTGVTGERASV